jgi:hypothetical protein
MALFTKDLPEKDDKGNPLNTEYVDGYNNPDGDNPYPANSEEHDEYEAGQDAGHDDRIDPDEPYYSRK